MQKKSLAVLTTLLSLVAACSLDHAVKHEHTAAARHGACVSCHRTETPGTTDGTVLFAGGIDPSSACLDCHHYETGHHPVDSEASLPAGVGEVLPLFNGRVRCLTCHQAHRHAAGQDLAEQPQLLRGGPYGDVREFCYRCHSRERYAGIDPHAMIDAEGAVREIEGRPACLFCHREQPDGSTGPDTVTLQADVAFLCRRCHASMSGSFLEQHFHAKPKKVTRREIHRTERLRDVALPLAQDGRITCSTCHNPHQEGVAMREAARAGADRPKRLRMAKEEICGACHAP